MGKIDKRSIPSQSVFPSKISAAVIASMIPLLHVNALVMSLQIGLPDELLVAVLQWAGEWILPAGIVSFHVSLEVVTASKQFATAFDMALEIRIFLGR